MTSRRKPVGKVPEARSGDGTVPETERASTRRNEPVVITLNSGKGGAGKSAMGHAAIHTALALGLKPLIFDYDSANPDLWSAWTEIDDGDRHALETASEDAWESLMQTIQAVDSSYVIVVDLPANAGVITESFLVPMMRIGGYHVTIWCLDPGRKPMDVLLKYGAGPTLEPIVVAKSTFKTDKGVADFEVWKQFGDSVDLRGGFTFDVPVLGSAVRLAMVEGGEAVMTVEDLATDRGAWSIDRVAADRVKPLRADRAKTWLATMRPTIERAIATARRVVP